MDEMKGDARSILFVDTDRGRIELVAFADESWGILRNGKAVCTWECDELADCLRTFLNMADRRPGAAGTGCAVPACGRMTSSSLHPGRLN